MVYVRLTNGFGNNLFQYNAATVLADFHNTNVLAIPPTNNYYAISSLENVGVKFATTIPSSAIRISGDQEYIKSFDKNISKNDMILSGYFEDYRFYLSFRKKLISNFPTFNKRSNSDLVIHLRTGDRLFMKNEFYLKPTADDYLRAIEQFDFEQLHIVTDMPIWEKINPTTLSNIAFHNTVPATERVPIEKSVNYFNSLVDAFEKFNPTVEKRSVEDDFNFIRTFDNILFEHGTMSWWAAFLSDASRVGVYGPWRPWKGKSNKNLSNIPLDNWFKWK